MELYSNEAERIVLGSLLIRSDLAAKALKQLSEASFYFEPHKVIWRSILRLNQASVAPDILTISDDLEKQNKLEYIGGSTYLAQLIEGISSVSNIDHHIAIIKNKELLLSFWEFFSIKAQDIKDGKINNPEKVLEETMQRLLTLNVGDQEKNITVQEICGLYTKIQEDYAEKKASGFQYLGIPTKFASLDRVTDGYQPECIWGIAAYTSTGKSTLQVNMIKKLLDQNKRVCLFSLEMGKEDLFSKLLALECEVSPVEITKGLLNNQIYAKQMAAKKNLSDKKLSIYTECVNYEDILLAMQTEMMKEKTDVFFLDYVQNLTSKKSLDQTRLITQAVKELQKMTRKLKTTLVLLSQISNESNKGGGSLEVGGKDSGAIRAASNVFLFLKRDGSEEEILERYRTGQDIPLKLILNKNRMGRIGSFALNLKQSSGIMYEPL